MPRNLVNNKLEEAHLAYCTRYSFGGSKKQFWKYIRAMRKDHSGVSLLTDHNQDYSAVKDKAYILNKQFQSVFIPTRI